MTQLNGSTFDGLVEFLELDLTGFGDSVYRYVNTSTFEADLPEFGTIKFRGEDYQPYPFISSGFQRGGENLVQPSIQLPDFMGAMAVVLAQYDNAPGAPVTRYQALTADIISGNQQAAFQTELYLLDSVSSDGLQLELSLATHLDFKRAKFPGFKMTREFYPGLGSNLQR